MKHPIEISSFQIPVRRIIFSEVILILSLIFMVLSFVVLFLFVIPFQDLRFSTEPISIFFWAVSGFIVVLSNRMAKSRTRISIHEYFTQANPRDLLDGESAVPDSPGPTSIFLTNQYLVEKYGLCISCFLANSMLYVSLFSDPSWIAVGATIVIIILASMQIPSYRRLQKWMAKRLYKVKALIQDELQTSVIKS